MRWNYLIALQNIKSDQNLVCNLHRVFKQFAKKFENVLLFYQRKINRAIFITCS